MAEEQKVIYWPVVQLLDRGWSEELIARLLPPPAHRRCGRSQNRRRCWPRDTVLEAEHTREFQTGRQPRLEKKRLEPADIQSALALAAEALEQAWQTPDAPETPPGPAPAPETPPEPPAAVPEPAPVAATEAPATETAPEAAPESTPAAAEAPEAPAAAPAARQRPVISDDWIELLAGHYHRAVCDQLPTVSWAQRIKSGQSMSYIHQFLALGRERAGSSITSVLKHFVTAGCWMGCNLRSSLMDKLRRNYRPTLLSLSRRVLEDFAASQPEADIDGLLRMADFPCRDLLSHPLNYIYSVSYVPHAIRTSLELLVALNPKDEYPAARAMTRRFVLHLGGTNTGKTYAGFQRLAQAPTGVYLAPLRLLALEAQEIMLHRGIDCSLTTGEEEDRREEDTHVAATAEKLDLQARYDVAVIDECQMISDPERGYAWTRAILGVLAPEVHLCAAPEAKDLLLRIIASCGEECQVVEHHRKTPLYCISRPLDYASVQPGDALITFSKVGVLSVAEDLRSRGKEPAIIYGALPYEVRQQEVRRFTSGETDVVVATDAIGMGMNLPVQRIVFLEMMKYDGHTRRDLYPAEVLQIAGRAGRYGIYDTGYANAEYGKAILWRSMRRHIPDLEKARLSFPEGLIGLEGKLSEIMERWNSIEDKDFFQKAYTVREIELCRELEEYTDDKELIYRFVMIPFDESDPLLKELWEQMFAAELNGVRRDFHDAYTLRGKGRTLQDLEELYSVCDLVYYYDRVFDHPEELEDVSETRYKICGMIMEILKKQSLPGKRCRRCGKILPWNYPYGVCEECFGARAGQE